jgi:LacI family transcriptional regulator
MNQNPVTVKEIAATAGYSVRTVCRVLNSDSAGPHRQKTREAVLAAARQLGYMPNAQAQAMRLGRTHAVALLLSSEEDRSHLPGGMFGGIAGALAEHDLSLVVTELRDRDPDGPTEAPRVLRQLMVDGLLVNYTHNIPKSLVSMIRSHRLPSVWINSRAEADCVYADDFNSAWRATEHLLSVGHRHVAYVDFHNDFTRPVLHYSVTDRQRGYEQAMLNAGLDPVVVREEGPLEAPDRAAAARQWLLARGEVTAAVTYSPWTLMPLWLAATTQLGLSVPRDLSLITFSDNVILEMGVGATTMLLPEPELGHAAVEMLLRKIESPEQLQAPEVLAAKLVAGETVSPPGVETPTGAQGVPRC